MPQPDESDVAGMENKLIMEEKMYDKIQMQTECEEKKKLLNQEQLDVYEAVIKAVDNKTDDVIFVYDHGGTGKTFLYGTISAKLRATNKIVLNVASSGIAALLLPGGRTTHSRFEIPIELFDDSTCNVRQNSQLAELLQQTSLIIWDEAPMDHRHAFEALDRTLRDVVSFKEPEASSKLFGGKVVLLEGDFRSMRVNETDGNVETRRKNQEFSEWLLAMGDGRLQAETEPHEDEATWIKIPEEYVYSTGKIYIKSMVQEIYPDFLTRTKDHNYLRERAILTPLNENADSINDYMVDLMPETYKVYKSCDEVCASSIDN
ncbi:uncharacterized protein LOC141629538 [Silene latifolia]|uniref:uncharacterized protein LOC141629538 n=1 Tax=Silene latifolia TaxID=37657 RepID=UPI003D77A661